MYLRKLAYALILTCIALAPAWAMSCGVPRTSTYQMKVYSIIFRGTPVKIENASETKEENVSIDFKVTQALKGFKGDRITIWCGNWYYDCRKVFKVGEERVVFARGFERPYTIQACDQQVFGELVESILKPVAETLVEMTAQLGKQIETPYLLWQTRADLYEIWGDKLLLLDALENLARLAPWRSSRNEYRVRILELLVRMHRFDEARRYATELLSARKSLHEAFEGKPRSDLADAEERLSLDDESLRIRIDPTLFPQLNLLFDRNERTLTFEEAHELIKMKTDAPFDQTKIDFTGMYLPRAKLRGLNFEGEDFGDAYLSGADLRGSNLARANLSQTRELSYAHTAGAIYNCHTRFPDRFDPEKEGMVKADPFCP